MPTKPAPKRALDKNRNALTQIEYLTRPSPESSTLTPYSYSILSAVNMCPIWGVVRYGHRKKYDNDYRAMALEYGSAAHEVFAAIYLWQVGFIQGLPEHMRFHANRIFGADRFEKALQTKDPNPDARDALISLGYNILDTGGFYDDPHDNIRTVNNLQLGIITYVDNVINDMERWPIWIADENDPTSSIGVEAAFDIELVKKVSCFPSDHYDTEGQGSRPLTKASSEEVVRYIGQIDRLHEIERTDPETNSPVYKLVLGENKTGSRLGDSWALQFDMAHQITGYMIGAYTITQRGLIDARVHGLKSSQTGHSDDFNPISPKPRDAEMFETFIDWALDAKHTYDLYMDNYELAPRYTHSCNRYFRPCAQLPFCTDTREGRKMQFEEMVTAELSPSEQAVMDRIGMLEI